MRSTIGWFAHCAWINWSDQALEFANGFRLHTLFKLGTVDGEQKIWKIKNKNRIKLTAKYANDLVSLLQVLGFLFHSNYGYLPCLTAMIIAVSTIGRWSQRVIFCSMFHRNEMKEKNNKKGTRTRTLTIFMFFSFFIGRCSYYIRLSSNDA